MAKLTNVVFGTNNFNIYGVKNSIRLVEVEDDEKIVSLEAYGNTAVQMIYLDKIQNRIWTVALIKGRSSIKEVDDLYVYAVSEINKLAIQPKYNFRTAQILHTPQQAGPQPTQEREPETNIKDSIDIYYPPKGAHGSYNWKDINWECARNNPDPIIASLYTTKAVVFPRFCRKAFGKYEPGQYICLGGRDAGRYNNYQPAVEFIIKHTAIRV